MAQALCLQGPHTEMDGPWGRETGRQAGLQGEGGGFVPEFHRRSQELSKRAVPGRARAGVCPGRPARLLPLKRETHRSPNTLCLGISHGDTLRLWAPAPKWPWGQSTIISSQGQVERPQHRENWPGEVRRQCRGWLLSLILLTKGP